MVKMDSFNQKT